MFKQDFGNIANRKTVEVDAGNNLIIKGKIIKDKVFSIDEIEALVINDATMLTNGYMYPVVDGETGDHLILSSGFYFSKKQADRVRELIDIIQESNNDVEIITKTIGEEMKKEFTKAANTSKAPKKKKVARNAVKCPKCKSTDVQFMDNKRKSFSVGKAVGGTVLTGGIGALAGFAGKKGKDRWHCSECGNVFEKKAK